MDRIQLPGALTPKFPSSTVYETMGHITRELTPGSWYPFQFIPDVYFYTQPALGQRHLGLETSLLIIYSYGITA